MAVPSNPVYFTLKSSLYEIVGTQAGWNIVLGKGIGYGETQIFKGGQKTVGSHS
jgi:hypothetical protein